MKGSGKRGSPLWVKGVSGNPKGRPKGSKDKRDILSEQERIELAKRLGITPLEFLLSVLRDDTASLAYKLDAARIAAPYMHMKMPVSVITNIKTDDVVLEVREAVGKLFATVPADLSKKD